MEKWPEPFQGLPWVALPVTEQDWTDLLPPSPLIFDPIHTELSTSFPTYQTLLKYRRSDCSPPLTATASAALTGVGTYLQGHFHPGASSYKHFYPARHGRCLQSPLSEEPEPQAAPEGLSSPHLGSLLTQEVICPSAMPPKQMSPNYLTSSGISVCLPSFHTSLSNLSKRSALNYCGVWGFFLSSRWQKGPSPFWLRLVSQQKLLWDLQGSASQRSPCTHLVSITIYCCSPSRETPSTWWQKNTDVEKIKTKYTVTHD